MATELIGRLLVSLISESLQIKEAKMPARKSSAKKKSGGKKKAGGSPEAVLRFNPRWFADPPPPFFKNLDRAAIRELAQLKVNVAKQVNQILAKSGRG